MNDLDGVSASQQNRILGMSTLAFTVCFAVWTIFSIIGVRIKQELGLSDTEFGLLVGTPILTGSLTRIFLGIWTDQYGGRIVYILTMFTAAIATFLLSHATTYEMILLAALGVGVAGGSFAVGIAYVSKWYPKEKQGTALGIFGVGNVGAAVTKFCAPFVLVAFGWQTVAQVWASVLVVIAIVFWLVTEDDPETKARRARGERARGTLLQLEPLKNQQVWRFALYYFFVFGGFVALALWLPRYMIGVYHLDIESAGMLAAMYSIPASVFRAYGGYLSDRYGARTIMYWTFGASMVCLFMLAYPQTDYVIHGIRGEIHFSTQMGLVPFTITIFVLGFFMSLGKAAVYKHIPVYYPGHVGAVGGLVGMIGGLGGFVLPIMFGVMNDLTGVPTAIFMLLFGLVAATVIWMHISIRQMEREVAGGILKELPPLAELQGVHRPAEHAGKMGPLLTDWRPEDPAFWEKEGRRIAGRNLWISVPCLLLAFSVWLVWSVVVAKLPSIGFKYTTDQLFWLAALPGLSGATLRIFYSFMVPIFGGRLWTTLTTASLLVPAFGIGYAVQDPTTPYFIFLVLALLCGLGGGNFASSMANISFFYPKSEKGNALALNAGLGNAGVSVMQFLVPIVVTAGVFGALGGEPQAAAGGTKLWLQNAGFVWVPFLIDRHGLRLVRHERHRRGESVLRGAGGDLPAQAQLGHVLALHRDLRLVHRLFGGLPAVGEDAVPGRELAAIRLPRSPRRRAQPGGDRLDLGQVRRRARHLLDIPADDRRGRRRALLPRRQGPAGRILGLLRDVPGAVLRHRRRQRLHLPDDPDHHARGAGAADAQHRPDTAPAARGKGIRRHHRLHLGDRGLRRLLHSEGLWHVDHHDRRTGGGAVGLPRLLRHLRARHLVLLYPAGRPAARRGGTA